MLQKLREKTTGWIAVLIVGALVVPFAFFGVNNYFTPDVVTYAAKVGEVDISPDDFRNRFENYRQEQRQALGDRYDPRALEDPTVRREVLERMIDEELLIQAAEVAGFTVTAGQLRDTIASIPAFQVDGRFDQTQYQLLLAAQAMSPRQFERRLQRDLKLRALPSGVIATALITDAELNDFIRLADQTRDIVYLAIDPPLTDEKVIDDEAVEQWYQRNQDRYLSPETVSIEYVELDASMVQVASTVDEDSLRQRYEDQRERYVEPEQRSASHILIVVPADADAAADATSQARARELAERIGAGEDFAQIARERSDDIGSRINGGELGWIERGLLDSRFEDALFALEPGQISEPVRTDDGWHLIRLDELREGVVKPFEQVRDELARQYLEGERERAYSELSGRLVDLSYRDPTSLATTAETLGLEVKTVGPFTRDGGEGVAALPEVISAAFSSQLVNEGLTSDPIDLGANHMLLLRVLEHQPSRPRPLDEVRAQIEQEIRDQRLAEAARESADALLARVQGGQSLESLSEVAGSEPQAVAGLRRFVGTPDRAIVDRAFSLPVPAEDADKEGSISVGLAELGPGRFALVQVMAVTDGDAEAMDPTTRNAIRSQLASARGDMELRAYLDALRTRIQVKVAEEQL